MLLDPNPARIRPGKAEFGLLRRCAAAGARLRRAPPPPAHPNPQRRPICFGRAQLDLEANESEPLDQDLTVHVRGYRFTLSVFLKSPPTFFKLTRSPGVFKSNCNLTLFLALRPLAFLRMEPAVQLWLFCMSALRTFWFLRFSPQFLQKTPWNLVFLADKPLELVFGLDYVF